MTNLSILVSQEVEVITYWTYLDDINAMRFMVIDLTPGQAARCGIEKYDLLN